MASRRSSSFGGSSCSDIPCSSAPGGANILQALVFAYAHAGVNYTPDALVFILLAVFPLGLFAGYLMRHSNGVVAPAIFHAGLDIPIYLAFLTFVS